MIQEGISFRVGKAILVRDLCLEFYNDKIIVRTFSFIFTKFKTKNTEAPSPAPIKKLKASCT